MPGNSFSHDRSTYGWSPAVSQTSPALYSFGVTTDASISAPSNSQLPSSQLPTWEATPWPLAVGVLGVVSGGSRLFRAAAAGHAAGSASRGSRTRPGSG